ncbi:RHS repeat-associated core domain-containing protein [Marinimicrobium sp. C6131]|uniref:RHS repeat domain-containing protein n=1 Tax=Marinimicrobium sp. C6131 TaxID=3022676 RepID=UPI00223E178E|nr:RHS repeat-associated core domain-containing protein [Marinimicrobium sp. C6131]UZJ43677.1 RHS repeat-associated core domain-containing protein [Marinimicrobium sp. C6131]
MQEDDVHGEAPPVQEDFGYDELNRLKWSKVSGREQVNVDYDALGNIKNKSDVGRYTYGSKCQQGAGPHALCKTSDGTTYSYDANGSMVGDSSGRTIEYSSFDKPTKISKGGHTTRFAYSPSRSRNLRTDESAEDAATLTRYLGNVERITHPDGRLEIKRRLPGGALISYSRSADGQPAGKTTHYLHMDHLGSIDIISNEIGQLVARMSFDPWGQRRDPLDWGPLVGKALSELETNITGITKRGFTGHEMLDEVGLIHMNGRIYDPRLGRFLQADPLIDGVTDTQGYNRYSYVHNNPLNATDPSGFSAWTRFRDNFLKPVIQAIVTFHCIPCGTALAAATTAYYGGDAFDVAVSAFSTYVMASMGKGFAASGGGFSGGEAFVFGVTGGITSSLRGGKFGHGFVSAYTGAVTGGFVQGLDNAAAELIASSVIAGSISEATGGKFANGAAYAAFSWAVALGEQKIKENRASEQSVRFGSLNEISQEDAERLYQEAKAFVLSVEEAAHVDPAKINLDNRYALINPETGEAEFFEDFNQAAKARRSGYGIFGGVERGGRVTIYRTAFSADIRAINLSRRGFDDFKFGFISSGLEAGVFIIGHEVAHIRKPSEISANFFGKKVLERYRNTQ